MPRNARAAVQVASGVLAVAVLTACGAAETNSAADAARDGDVTLVDAAHPDTVTGTDANGIDGDGGCACFPFDNAAGPNQAVITTSLECFSINAQWMYDYEAYAKDPCIGLPPYRREDIYAERNLIGVWSTDSVRQEPLYGYFYEATTKALVGALRAAAWQGDDPSSCTPGGPHGGGRYNRLRAGILPNCQVNAGGFSCLASSTRQVTCPPPDAGATDVADDGG